MKKYLILALCAIISVGLITGCESKKEDKNNNKTETKEDDNKISNDVINCQDCVYAYYNDEKKYGENGDILSNYTKDFKTLKDENGNQRKIFLGHIIDDDNKIIKGFVCRAEFGKVFCLEGSTNGSTYESNVNVINELFENEDKLYLCSLSENYEQFDYNVYACRNDYIGGPITNGSVYATYVDGNTAYMRCDVYNNGTMYCIN